MMLMTVDLAGNQSDCSTDVVKAAAVAERRARDLVDRVQSTLCAADQAILRNRGDVSPELEQQIRAVGATVVLEMHDLLGPQTSMDDSDRARIGQFLQRALLPYVLLTETVERLYSKPRGFAGDYLSIRMLYHSQGRGTGRLGPILDQGLLAMQGPQAVRNRRPLLASEIRQTVDQVGDRPARITSLGSGPADEFFDVFALPGFVRQQLRATCVDLDLDALAFVANQAQSAGLRSQFTLLNVNLLKAIRHPELLAVADQDLIYSVGLIDYLNDCQVVGLLNCIHDRLRPGGRVILGNFHPSNPCREFMDYVIDWKLIHRDVDDMNRLFSQSQFARPCSEIRFEATGINLFAVSERRFGEFGRLTKRKEAVAANRRLDPEPTTD